MSDSIENQINQFTLEQNSSPQVPTFRSKKNKNKILAAVALIMLLAVGAISSFILLGQKQDTRNQASVAQGLVNIKLQRNADCAIGQTCYVDVLVNTGSSNIDALQAKVVFDQNSVGSVDSISFKPSENLNYQRQMPTESGVEVSVQGNENTNKPAIVESGTATSDYSKSKAEVLSRSGQGEAFAEKGSLAEKRNGEVFIEKSNLAEKRNEEGMKMMEKSMLSLAKNEVSPSKEVLLAWTLMNSSIPFNSNNSDYLLGRIEFVAKQAFKSGDSTNNMTISLDPSFSKATLYKTGQDSLNTPSPLTIAINMATTTITTPCKVDANCVASQYCYYEPTPSGVQNFRAIAYCKDRIVKQGTCQTDADCAKNEYCYEPPMPVCPEGAACKMSVPVKSCKERIVTATATPVVSVTPGKINCKTNGSCPTGQYCYQEPAPICPNGQVCPTFKTIDSYCKDVEIKPGTCRTDVDCARGQICYQPPMSCPSGQVCPQVMPAKYCKEDPATQTPTPVVSISIKPSITPISCAVPTCKNGVLRLMTQPYGSDVNSATKQSWQSCPTYVCEEIISCEYVYSDWSECKYGVQNRTISGTARAKTTTCSAPILSNSCNRPCSSDSNCSTGEVCVRQAQTTTVDQTSADRSSTKILNMGYCAVNKTTPLTYDLNGDGAVNVLDLSIVISNLFTNNEKADINKDKVVDIADYSLVLKNLINREFAY